MKTARRLRSLAICALLTSSAVLAQAPAAEPARDLLDLSLEELMNEPITSVSKRETRLGDAAAAISVVTAEDIRRAGVTSIPEALRMVPGLNVARVTSNKWDISARGFNNEYASKLLVLVDGRSVYTPTFAGVHWDDQDLLLEDVARIEVIRGPGATLWGANAMNGVINIITKSATDTQGFLSSIAYGTEERPSASLRYGGASGEHLHYRLYARYFDRDDFEDSNGQATADAWRSARGGFRLDWQPPGDDDLTLQGDLYSSDVEQDWMAPTFNGPPINLPVTTLRDHHGGNLLGRWTRRYSDTSSSSLQVYYDRVQHIDTGSLEKRDTVDLDWQHRFELSMRQDLTWGLGYRRWSDDFPPTATGIYTPQARTMALYSAFVQDEMRFAEDRLHVTVGSKFEHNDFTGFEIQPSMRALWRLDADQTIWASVARAVRTPSRGEHDIRLNAQWVSTNPPVLLVVLGNPSAESEDLMAYELGFRSELNRTLSLDLATFYNVYHHVLDAQPASPFFEVNPLPPHVVTPLVISSDATAEAYGAELTLQWTPMDNWRLNAGYTLLRMQTHPAGTLLNPGNNARHQAQLRSYLNVSHDLELNGAVYYVDRLEAQAIPAYVRLDFGLVWRPTQQLELGIWGQNLLDDRHIEFPSLNSGIRTEIPRTALGRITWSF